MDEFSKRYSRLKNAHTAIKERMSQGARFRDGVRTHREKVEHVVTNKSQMGAVVSIEQNDNISLLTWITVLYLPLGLVVVRSSTNYAEAAF